MNLSQCQCDALNAIKDWLNSKGQFFVLSGGAGTGKSFLLNEVLDYVYKENALNKILYLEPLINEDAIAITATTHNARHLIQVKSSEGEKLQTTTLHSLFGLVPRTSWQTGITSVDYTSARLVKSIVHGLVIIDEASMLESDFIKLLHLHTQTKFLLVCDAAQLPSVGEQEPAFMKFNFPFFDMKTNMRSLHNQVFASFLTEYREDILNDRVNFSVNTDTIKVVSSAEFVALLERAFITKGNNNKYIAYTNKSVTAANEYLNMQYNNSTNFAVGSRGINHNVPRDSGLANLATFYVHASVATEEIIEHFNPKKRTIEIIKVKGCKINNKYFVPDDVTKIASVLKKLRTSYRDNQSAIHKIMFTWLDLRPDYAITVNRAQGQTYNDIFVDMSSFKSLIRTPKLLTRMLYVVFSRAQGNIYITGGIV